MANDTTRFGVPFAGLALGLVILVIGIFMGGLTTVAIVGGAVAFLSILALSYAAFSVASASA